MKVRGDFLGPPRSTDKTTLIIKVSKGAKIRNRYNHRLQTNPQDSEEEPHSTKSHKTSRERYVHYTDLTRSWDTIKHSPLDYVHG